MRRVEINLSPFPYAVCHPALPWDRYWALEKAYPSWEEVVDDRPVRQNARYDWSGKTCLRKAPQIWKDFVWQHTSPTWWHSVVDWFGPVINLVYPQIRWAFDGDLKGAKTALRFTDRADFYLDCQIGVNTPCSEMSTVSPPHLDNPVQLIGGLLYFGEDDCGGDLLIHGSRRLPTCAHKRVVRDAGLGVDATVKYAHNTAVFFLNTPWSVHSVTHRTVGAPARRLVTIPVEVNAPLFGITR